MVLPAVGLERRLYIHLFSFNGPTRRWPRAPPRSCPPPPRPAPATAGVRRIRPAGQGHEGTAGQYKRQLLIYRPTTRRLKVLMSLVDRPHTHQSESGVSVSQVDTRARRVPGTLW